MRIAYFIFAVYMAFLSVYPCYEDDCMDEITAVITIDQDGHEKGEPDLCSPFCVSACCAIHVFYNTHFESAITFHKDLTVENSTYTLRLIPLVVVSIWQPPKLV